MHNYYDNSDLQFQISTNTTDPAELLRLLRELCQGDCVSTILPACQSQDPSIEAGLNQIMEGNIIILIQAHCHACHIYIL